MKVWILLAYMSQIAEVYRGVAGTGGPVVMEFKTKEECLWADKEIRKHFGKLVGKSLCIGKIKNYE